MSRGIKIPWVGVYIPWVGGQYTIGRRVKIPWIGEQNTTEMGSKYNG
jgi:hypothetical protein